MNKDTENTGTSVCDPKESVLEGVVPDGAEGYVMEVGSTVVRRTRCDLPAIKDFKPFDRLSCRCRACGRWYVADNYYGAWRWMRASAVFMFLARHRDWRALR